MTPYYDRDGITIYHADCADVLPTIDPVLVDLVLTDPPYGMSHDGRIADRSKNGRVGGKQASSRNWAPVAGDDEPFDPSPLLCFSRVIMWGANHYSDRLPASPKWFVWSKVGDGSGQPPMVCPVELAWSNLPGSRPEFFAHVWHGAPRWRDEPVLHPTQKPAALMRWIVERWTEPGDLILDPYMGSGPVAQACADLGRHYIGIEIVEEYCETAVKRLAQQVFPLDGATNTQPEKETA